MRVAVVAVGSRGDVAPFVGLSHDIAAAGHEVVVATHPMFEGMVRHAGLGFLAVPGDIAAVVAVPSTDRPPSPMFMSRRVGGLTRYLKQAGLGAVAAVSGAEPDVVVGTGTAPFAFDIAEGLGVPSLGAYLQPYEPSADYPPVLLNSTRSWGGLVNKGLGRLAPSLVFPYTRATKAVRESMGLPRRGPGATRRRQAEQRMPVFHGFSPAVLPRPRDWRPGMEVVGYWWPVEDAAWQPPAGLEAFLADGPAPIVVSFGSMANGAGPWLVDAVVGAIRSAGVRAIVQAGWAGLDVDADDQLLPLGEAPHSWLFPRAAAVVHHGGAGTSGAVFRAGVPAVVTPIYADQPLWAARAHALGAAPKPIPFTQMSAVVLADAIHSVVTDAGYRSRAVALAEAVATDRSCEPVIAALRRLAG